MGKGKVVDLSAVAAATDGLSGAELELIVNEAAIFAVRRVSAQLKDASNGSEHIIDSTVYPHDFEASVKNFFISRGRESADGKRKQFGFDISGADDNKDSRHANSANDFGGGQTQIFTRKPGSAAYII